MSELGALLLSVGERCADCHQSIVESYARTGMARALEPIAPGELAGLAAVDDAAGWRYRFEALQRGARIVESRAAASGVAAPAELAYELLFAIGAGELDRSYAARHGQGVWFAPLEVLSASEREPRHAALAPGHSIEPGMRLANPITPECLACHTDAPRERNYPLNALPAPDWRPRGIGCAACHAHAEEHADWREREATSAQPEALGGDPNLDPILDHGALGRAERLSVCAACHLQGDARLELSNERLGPPPPGGDLLASRAVFVAAHPDEEIGFVSQVERLVLSRCFTASPAMACESCHDPHVSALGAQGASERARVRAACNRCHADAGASGDGCSLPVAERGARDCVDCHMRRTGVFDVAEVEIHDHWIQRLPLPVAPPPHATDAKPLRLLESDGGALALFAWPGAPPQPHAEDPGLWMMAEAKAGLFESARARARATSGPVSNSLAMYHHVRASLLERSGTPADLEQARLSYKRALILDARLGEAANNLGLLLGKLGRPDEGRRVLSELLAWAPLAEGALRNRAVLAAQVGDRAAALADLEAAFALRPQSAVARILADNYAELGDAALAARWHAEAARWACESP